VHSWETKIPFPDDMLHAMQQHHPTAQLSIYSTDLNQAVVLSSQLRRLDVSIPCSDDFRPASVAPFEQLRRLLVQNSNVRALSIKIHHDPALRERAEREEMEGLSQLTPNSIPGLDVVPHGPTIESNTIVATDVANKIQIPLNSTDRLPPLELLSIESERYNLDLEHIGCLYICMDWTKLKRLKLGPSNPVAFFETFTGQAPLLEHLDISFHSNPSLTACSTFVASLNMLRELVIRCDLISQTRTFWPVLARTHGDVLEHLTLRSRYEGVEAHIWPRPVWENSLGSFIRNFTSLRSLDITLRLDDGAQTRCRHCSHPLVVISLALVKPSTYMGRIPATWKSSRTFLLFKHSASRLDCNLTSNPQSIDTSPTTLTAQSASSGLSTLTRLSLTNYLTATWASSAFSTGNGRTPPPTLSRTARHVLHISRESCLTA
jgi:hypothetical protein